MTLSFILNMFGSNKEKDHLFTVRSGDIVHYNMMTAGKIQASGDYGAVFADEVLNLWLTEEDGRKVTELELEEVVPSGQVCIFPFIRTMQK